MFLFHRGYIKHLFAKGKSFALLFPVLPKEYPPSWWVFSYSGNQLNIHIDTHTVHTDTKVNTHLSHIEPHACGKVEHLTHGSDQLFSTSTSSLNVKNLCFLEEILFLISI